MGGSRGCEIDAGRQWHAARRAKRRRATAQAGVARVADEVSRPADVCLADIFASIFQQKCDSTTFWGAKCPSNVAGSHFCVSRRVKVSFRHSSTSQKVSKIISRLTFSFVLSCPPMRRARSASQIMPNRFLGAAQTDPKSSSPLVRCERIGCTWIRLSARGRMAATRTSAE